MNVSRAIAQLVCKPGITNCHDQPYNNKQTLQLISFLSQKNCIYLKVEENTVRKAFLEEALVALRNLSFSYKLFY